MKFSIREVWKICFPKNPVVEFAKVNGNFLCLKGQEVLVRASEEEVRNALKHPKTCLRLDQARRHHDCPVNITNIIEAAIVAINHNSQPGALSK